MAAHADTRRSWGLIAGNGDFPFLVLEGARSRGIEMAVIAIREEASPALERAAKSLHWISLGELSRGIDLLHQEGVTHAVMAGQVKHNKIFSSIRPDWRLAKLLLSLPSKNTDSLIGAVARVLQDEGIERSTPPNSSARCLPAEGSPNRRAPDATEAPTSPTAAKSPSRSPVSTWAKPSSSAIAPASPSKPWKARTKPSSAPRASPAASASS